MITLRWIAEVIGATMMITGGVAATALGVALAVSATIDKVIKAWNLFDDFVEFAVTRRREKRRTKSERGDNVP